MTVTTSLQRDPMPASTAAVLLDSSTQASLQSSFPGWRFATRPGESGSSFLFYRATGQLRPADPARNGAAATSGDYYCGPHGSGGNSTYAAFPSAGTLTVGTLADASVGDLVLISDGIGHWIPVKVMAVA